MVMLLEHGCIRALCFMNTHVCIYLKGAPRKNLRKNLQSPTSTINNDDVLEHLRNVVVSLRCAPVYMHHKDALEKNLRKNL
jgi:hypothetical protein